MVACILKTTLSMLPQFSLINSTNNNLKLTSSCNTSILTRISKNLLAMRSSRLRIKFSPTLKTTSMRPLCKGTTRFKWRTMLLHLQLTSRRRLLNQLTQASLLREVTSGKPNCMSTSMSPTLASSVSLCTRETLLRALSRTSSKDARSMSS